MGVNSYEIRQIGYTSRWGIWNTQQSQWVKTAGGAPRPFRSNGDAMRHLRSEILKDDEPELTPAETVRFTVYCPYCEAAGRQSYQSSATGRCTECNGPFIARANDNHQKVAS